MGRGEMADCKSMQDSARPPAAARHAPPPPPQRARPPLRVGFVWLKWGVPQGVRGKGLDCQEAASVTSTRTRRLTVARRAAAAAATAAVLAGCTASRGAGPQPAATTGPSARATSATATPASTEAAARLAAEQAYARFWPVAWDIDKSPQPRWRPLLAAVATDPVLTRLLSTAGIQARQGITRYGMVTPHVVS